MGDTLGDRRREAAEEFARRVGSKLGDEIDSIVLYGSVARGEASEENDIDILVIAPDAKDTRDRVGEIAYDFEYKRNFDCFISIVDLSRDEFSDRVEHGYPFLSAVFEDGVILLDNGTFSIQRRTLMNPSEKYMGRQMRLAEDALEEARTLWPG